MKTSTVIRQATRDDEPSIREYLRTFYGPRFVTKYPARWNWQFAANPFAPDKGLPILLACAADGQIVGQLGLQYAPLWIDGRSVRCAWGVDFGVLRSHRGEGIGGRLQAEAAKVVPYLLSAVLDESAVRIKKRLGFVPGRQVRCWRRFLSLSAAEVRDYLEAKVERRSPAWRRGVGILTKGQVGVQCAAVSLRFASACYAAVRRSRGVTRGHAVEELQRFGPDIDVLWQSCRSAYLMTTRRDSEFLNWRYADCPGLRYRCFRAVSGGLTQAYAVIRERQTPEPRSVRIVDLFCNPAAPGALEALFRHIVDLFGRTTPVIEVASSDPVHARVLRRMGFFRGGLCTPWAGGSAIGAGGFRRLADAWLVTMGDQDWDQFRPLRQQIVSEPPSPETAAASAKRGS